MLVRKWDIQFSWQPWFSFGAHFDHTDPSITFHLPWLIVCLGRCKQPGFRHVQRKCRDVLVDPRKS